MSKFKVESVLVVAILVICFALMVPSIVVDALAGILHEGWFPVRSIVLILLGGCFMWLVYRIVKQERRFRTKTFSEILDDMIGATMWKQLLALLCLSIIAFLFSWALTDILNPIDASGAKLTDHQTFWLTICYFFDPGNLNLTPHDKPGWQGAISLIVAILGMTLLTGLFISTFTNVIDRRVAKVRAGEVTYKGIRGHSVVIGYCDLTESVIRGLLEDDVDAKVIMLTNHDIEDVRKSLYRLLNSKEYDGRIVLYSGDYRMDENLQRLNLPVTKSIYILGDDEMQSRDYENLATAQRVSNICASSEEDLKIDEPVPLYIRMDRMPSFSTLQRLDIDENFFSKKVYFRPFNYYEHWTRMLWTKRKVEIYDVSGKKRLINYPSLFFDKTAEGQKRYVHLVVSGFSEMGMAVTLQAIRLAHYGNNTTCTVKNLCL